MGDAAPSTACSSYVRVPPLRKKRDLKRATRAVIVNVYGGFSGGLVDARFRKDQGVV